MVDENSTPTPEDAQVPDTDISATPAASGASDDIPTAQTIPSSEIAAEPVTPEAAAGAAGGTEVPTSDQAASTTEAYVPQNPGGATGQPDYSAPQNGYTGQQQQGYAVPPQQAYTAPQQAEVVSSGKDHIVAGVLALLLGTLGIHKFYMGYNTEGIILLLISLIGGCVTFGIATIVVEVIVFVEGIIYLTKSQQEFDSIYVYNKKGWF